jgi:hypothetical protein
VGRGAATGPATTSRRAVRKRLLTNGVEVWAERDDPDSRSLHFRDVAGNAIIAAQLLT